MNVTLTRLINYYGVPFPTNDLIMVLLTIAHVPLPMHTHTSRPCGSVTTQATNINVMLLNEFRNVFLWTVSDGGINL